MMKNWHRIAKAGLALCAVALLAGCGHRIPDRELRFKSQHADQDPSVTAAQPARCGVYVDTIEDARNKHDQFGTAHGFELFESSIVRWVRDSIASLAQQGYKVTFAESNTAPTDTALWLRLKVHKTYVHHVATSINANIVVTIDFLSGDAMVESKTYRGTNTSVNMVGAPGEVELGLNRAMTALLADVSVDIDRLCRAPGRQTSAAR